jgi:hypothetical protein
MTSDIALRALAKSDRVSKGWVHLIPADTLANLELMTLGDETTYLVAA